MPKKQDNHYNYREAGGSDCIMDCAKYCPRGWASGWQIPWRSLVMVAVGAGWAALHGVSALFATPQDPDTFLVEAQQQDIMLDAPAAINVQQAVAMAIAYDPGFQQIRWSIEKSQGDRHQATRYPNATMGVITNEMGNDGAAGQYGVFWSRNLVRNQRQAIQHRYFSMEIAALQQQYDIRRWQLSRNIGTRMLTATRFLERYQLTLRQINGLQEILGITQNLFGAGEISRVAVTNIELEIDRLRQVLVELQLKREFELRALAVPLGMAETSRPSPDVPEIELDWQETIGQLMDPASTALEAAWLASHPQIAFANAQAEQSRIQIELAKAQQCPDVQVQASINYDALTDDPFGGLQIGVPIMKYDRKYGMIAAAGADYQRSCEAVRLKQMQLQSAYTLGEGELARLRSHATNIREVLIPKAQENLRQIRGAFEAGEAEFLLLRTGVVTVLELQLELLDTEYELAVSAVNLRTLLLEE